MRLLLPVPYLECSYQTLSRGKILSPEGDGGEERREQFNTREFRSIFDLCKVCFGAGFEMNFPCTVKENALCGWGTILGSHDLEFPFCGFLLLVVETSNMFSFGLARGIREMNKPNLDAWKSRVGESKESQNQQNERHIELLLLVKRS